ncbi:MAG: hypothetical protein WC809_17580 [Sinimarinibacterium sp.]|jgi:hypothetical protein
MAINEMQRRILSAFVLGDYRFRDCFVADPLGAAQQICIPLQISDSPESFEKVNGVVVVRRDVAEKIYSIGHAIDDILGPLCPKNDPAMQIVLPLIASGDLGDPTQAWDCSKAPKTAAKKRK